MYKLDAHTVKTLFSNVGRKGPIRSIYFIVARDNSDTWRPWKLTDDWVGIVVCGGVSNVYS